MTEVIRPLDFSKDYGAYATLLRHEQMFSPDRDQPSRIHRTIQTPNSIFVAETDRKTVGAVYVGDGNGIGLIQGLGVYPGYEGRGIGTKLLSAAEKELARRGYSKAEVQIDIPMDPNDSHSTQLREWYRKRGYHKWYQAEGWVKNIGTEFDPFEVDDAFRLLYGPLRWTRSDSYNIPDVSRFRELFKKPPIDDLYLAINTGANPRLTTTTLSSTPWSISPSTDTMQRWVGPHYWKQNDGRFWLRLIEADSNKHAEYSSLQLDPDGYYAAYLEQRDGPWKTESHIIVPFQIAGEQIFSDYPTYAKVYRSLLESAQFHKA